MYLVLIAWLYVALMMAAAEATASNGTLLGAVFTFLLYGVLPVALIGYLLDSPRRSRANKALEARQAQAAPSAESVSEAIQPPAASVEPDAGGEAATAAEPQRVAPVRKEP